MRSQDSRALVALTAIWLGLVFAIHPSFAFPLNDDWSFTAMLANLTERHLILPTDVTSMPLVGQIVWAAPFVWLTGSVLEGARVSTLVLGFVGPAALWFCLRQLGATIAVSLLAALALMTNPLWLSLSCTFMTDVPFTAVALVATALFIAGTTSGRRGLYALALAAVVWATLIRQLALAFAVGAAALPWPARPSARTIVRACAPFALCAMALAGYSAWLAHAAGLPVMYQRREFEALTGVAAIRTHLPGVALGIIAACLYTGWALVPVAPLIAAAMSERSATWRSHGFIALVSGALFAGVLMLHKLLPITGNIVDVSGLGAMTLAGADMLPSLPIAVRAIGTLLAIWSGVYAAWAVATSGPWPLDQPRSRTLLFLLLTALSYIGVITQVWVFDRYVLPLIAVAVITALGARRISSPPRWAIALAAALVVVNASIGVLGTRDYFAWNAARWNALADLARQRVAPADIDGGYEYNGATSYDPRRPLGSFGWWQRTESRYRVSFAPASGWTVVATYPYHTLLPPADRELFVLQK